MVGEKKIADLGHIEIGKGRITARCNQFCSSSAPRQRQGSRRTLMLRKRRIRRVRQAAVFVSIVFLVGGLYFYRGLSRSNEQSKLSAKKHVVVVSPARIGQDSGRKKASRKKEAGREKIAPIFARVPSLNLTLYFLADFPAMIGIGFHQASNPKAIPLEPAEPCFRDRAESTVHDALSKKRDAPLFFIMASRGRGRHPSSAADIGFKPGTRLKSPVDGVVTKSQAYSLYGRYNDWRLEIAPRGHPGTRVVIIHLDEVPLEVGDKVYRMRTVIGKPRSLRESINPQINRYIFGECDHVHLQVNPYEPEQPPS